MIVIVEGIDRVGKTTFIDKMCKSRMMIRFKDKNECSKTYKDDDFGSFSLGKLDTSVCFLKQMNDYGLDIIVDRLHLTEIVYGCANNRRVHFNKIKELDKILSEMETILVYVQPADLAWSSEQAGTNQTTHNEYFESEFMMSKIEKYKTNFKQLDEMVDILNYRMDEINKQKVQKKIKSVQQFGEKVNNTKEYIADYSTFRNITTDEIKNTFDIDTALLKNFKEDVTTETETKYGVYDIKEYFGLFDKLNDAVLSLKTDNMHTRRSVLHFENKHCFQTIQFLVRHNKLTVICNMRSCNVIDNYQNDILICSILADEFKKYYKNVYENGALNQTHDIIMNIGSLHYFVKEENKNASE